MRTGRKHGGPVRGRSRERSFLARSSVAGSSGALGFFAVLVPAVLVAACSSMPSNESDGFPGSSAERALLDTLRYDAAEPPADVSNRFAGLEGARAFGQRLFFEKALSGPLIDGDNDGSEVALGKNKEPGHVSCAGCHLPESGFVDTRSLGGQVSLGARWSLRRTPQLAEVAFAPLYNWDGRRESLWNQAIGVMENDREFNSGRLFVAQQIARLHRQEYEAIFGALPALDDAARFPALAPAESGCRLLPGLVLKCRGKPGDGAEYDAMASQDQDLVTEVVVNVGKAIAAYVAQLRCGPSRFDAWLDGDESALTKAEQNGAALFVGRAGCVSCHSGPLLTDQRFHNVGLKPERVAVVVHDVNDRGAGEGIPHALQDPLNSHGKFSDGNRSMLPPHVGPELEGAFRTPTLRCVATQPSFMHTGQYRSLEEVVAFFNDGGHASGYPGSSELKPLGLSPAEQSDLVAFLYSLVGEGAPQELRAPPPEFTP